MRISQGGDWMFNKKDMWSFLIAFLLLAASLLLFIFDNESKYISILSFGLSAFFCIKFRNNLPILIMYIFLSLYTLESTKFFFSDILLSGHRSFQTKDIVNKVLIINNLFLFALGVSIPSGLHNFKFDLKRYGFESRYLFVLLLIAGLLMIQFGIKGESLLEGSGYGRGHSQKSTMHEYFILIYLLLLLVYPPKSILAKICVNALFLIYSFKTLIFGGRVEVMEIVLLFLYFFWLFKRKINRALFFSTALIVLYLNAFYSAIRANPLILLTSQASEVFNPVNLFFAKSDRPYLTSNEGDVLQASTRMLGLIQEGYLNSSNRIGAFFSYLFSWIVPTSLMPEYANLASYKQSLFSSGGGGLIGVYFFVWLGYAGPLLVGVFIGFIIKKLYVSKDTFFKVYGTSVLITFPRWYAYSPIFLIKFCFYSIILYFIIRLFFNVFLKKDPKPSEIVLP